MSTCYRIGGGCLCLCCSLIGGYLCPFHLLFHYLLRSNGLHWWIYQFRGFSRLRFPILGSLIDFARPIHTFIGSSRWSAVNDLPFSRINNRYSKVIRWRLSRFGFGSKHYRQDRLSPSYFVCYPSLPPPRRNVVPPASSPIFFALSCCSLVNHRILSPPMLLPLATLATQETSALYVHLL